MSMKDWRHFNLWTFWHQPFCENIFFWNEIIIIIEITLKWILMVDYSNSGHCVELSKVPQWNLLQLRLLWVQGWILELRINPLAYNFLINKSDQSLCQRIECLMKVWWKADEGLIIMIMNDEGLIERLGKDRGVYEQLSQEVSRIQIFVLCHGAKTDWKLLHFL